MSQLPDDALVIRGGLNLPGNFILGSGLELDEAGLLEGVSVNARAGASVSELTAANSKTGYPGIPNTLIAVSTVGAIRAAGGEVKPSPTRHNPSHATLSGLTPEKASELFQPTVINPNRAARSKGEKS